MLPEKRPYHPGVFVKEDILKEFSISEEELAAAMGISSEIIYKIINEEERITADLALRLGRFTNTTPELWLNLQLAIDLWDARHSLNYQSIKNIKPFIEVRFSI